MFENKVLELIQNSNNIKRFPGGKEQGTTLGKEEECEILTHG